MLDSDPGIRLERLEGELVTRTAQGCCVELTDMTIQQPRDEVEDSRLTGSGGSVEHEELLNPGGVPREYGSDGPLELLSLVRIV